MSNKNISLLSLSFIAMVAVFAQGPITQDPGYHLFADRRTAIGLPNGYNVLSNLFFIVPGAWGAVTAFLFMKRTRMDALLVAYFLFFTGVFLTGVGSSYYHFNPSNDSLVWDRLPMTIAFMALFSSVISESIDRKAGAVLLGPLLVAGVWSVVCWAQSGDLRMYAVVQFLPIILIPVILIFHNPPRVYSLPLWSLIGLYAGAKVFEHFDHAVFSAGNIVSGHTMKHVLAGLGTACIVAMLNKSRRE